MGLQYSLLKILQRPGKTVVVVAAVVVVVFIAVVVVITVGGKQTLGGILLGLGCKSFGLEVPGRSLVCCAV